MRDFFALCCLWMLDGAIRVFDACVRVVRLGRASRRRKDYNALMREDRQRETAARDAQQNAYRRPDDHQKNREDRRG